MISIGYNVVVVARQRPSTKQEQHTGGSRPFMVVRSIGQVSVVLAVPAVLVVLLV